VCRHGREELAIDKRAIDNGSSGEKNGKTRKPNEALEKLKEERLAGMVREWG